MIGTFISKFEEKYDYLRERIRIITDSPATSSDELKNVLKHLIAYIILEPDGNGQIGQLKDSYHRIRNGLKIYEFSNMRY